jgi:hypothetical protein
MMQFSPRCLDGNNDLLFFEEQIQLAQQQLEVPIE